MAAPLPTIKLTQKNGKRKQHNATNGVSPRQASPAQSRRLYELGSAPRPWSFHHPRKGGVLVYTPDLPPALLKASAFNAPPSTVCNGGGASKVEPVRPLCV